MLFWDCFAPGPFGPSFRFSFFFLIFKIYLLLLFLNAETVNPHPLRGQMGVRWCCVFADPMWVSPQSPALGAGDRCKPPGKFGRLSGAFFHREASGNDRPDRTRTERDAAPQGPEAATRHPAARLGRSPPPEPAGRALGPAPAAGASPPATRRRFLGIARPAAASRPLPSPNQQINTTFYEKKTNFSDVTHLWCSRLLGRVSRGPGARWARREPHSPVPHGHTTRTVTPRDTQNGRAAAAGATKEPRTEKLRAGEGGRVRARAAAAGVSVSVCARVCVSVSVRVRSRRLTPAGRGSGSLRQEAGAAAAAAGGQGRGRRALRTRSLHMEEAFLDD